MTRSLTDAAIVLSIIAGKDNNDNFTLAQPSPVPDFTKALNVNGLKGKRIGVPRRAFLNDSITGNDPFVNIVFEQALNTIRSLGATVIDPADLPSADEIVVSNNETIVLDVDFKVRIPHLELGPEHEDSTLVDSIERLVPGPPEESVGCTQSCPADQI